MKILKNVYFKDVGNTTFQFFIQRHIKQLFIDGYTEMAKRLQPETIIFYGNIPEECMGNIIHVKAFTDKFKEAKCNGW